jgi:1,4-dihydroxy-2-naphthoyl-CoA synthase
VHYEVQEGVAIFTLDDPPANTYTHEMMVQIDAAILRARFDPSVDVIVIVGKGEKFFCAGPTSTCSSRRTPPGSTTSACTPTRRCCGWSTRPSW